MSEDQKKQLQTQLWNIANELRGKMNADDVAMIKTIETYEAREAKDKYGYVVPLAEVEENDYNLNIPHYVDTFEKESPIGLEEVATEIKKLDHDMVETDEKITSYCKELGIKPPSGDCK